MSANKHNPMGLSSGERRSLTDASCSPNEERFRRLLAEARLRNCQDN